MLPAFEELLAAGVLIGVLTNGDEDQQRRKLVAIGVLDRLDFFYSSSSLPAAKPDPLAFHVACTRSSRVQEDVVYVGDDPFLVPTQRREQD